MAWYELVIVDAATKQVRPVVARAGVRVVNPSWTADGRSILFAANVGDEPFNIYAVSVGERSVRRVTDSVRGASAPEVSPDGRSLLYVGYTVDGYDLFTIPFDPATWRQASWPTDAVHVTTAEATDGSLQAYRPWRSLRPTYWSPVVATDAGELLIGAGTAMSDVLGRHAYAIDAAWNAARARPDWHASYAYDRWWPTLFASYSDDTDPISHGDSRARELLTGALLPIRRLRWIETVLAAFDFEADSLECAAGCSGPPHRQLGSLRTGWIHNSRRQFGYSISAEEGVQLEAAVESTRTALGADSNATAGVFDVRGFQRLVGHTVLAGRAALAAAWGPLEGRRLFSAAGPGPSVAAFDFGRDAIGLLRGVAADDVVGSRAAVLNADLRFPLSYPQRGPGSWPIFLQSLHAAVFVDAAQAWDRAVRLTDFRTSAGIELSADTVLGHYLPLTFAGGLAWTHDPIRRPLVRRCFRTRGSRLLTRSALLPGMRRATSDAEHR